MQVYFSLRFKRALKRIIYNNKNLENRFKEKFDLFLQNPFQPTLKTHKLIGKLNDYWSFSVAYDCRVVFTFVDDNRDKVIFINIGTHDEVY